MPSHLKNHNLPHAIENSHTHFKTQLRVPHMKYEVIKTLRQQSPSLNPAELGVHNLHVKCVKRESRVQVQTITHVKRASGTEFYYEIAHRAQGRKQAGCAPQISQLIRTICDYYYITNAKRARVADL